MLIPNLLKTAGVNKFITIDIHSMQSATYCQEIFGENFLNLSTVQLFSRSILAHYSGNINSIILGSTDGSDKKYDRALTNLTELQHEISCPNIFYIKKTRLKNNIISSLDTKSAIKDKVCIILDDII